MSHDGSLYRRTYTGRHHIGAIRALEPEFAQSAVLSGVGSPLVDVLDSAEPDGGDAALRPVGANIAIVAAANLFPAVAGLAVAPVLAIAVGVTGRGDIAAGTAPLLLATAGGTFGMPEAITFIVARHPRLLSTALKRGAMSIAAAGLVAMALIFVSVQWLAKGNASLRELILLATLALIPTLLGLVLRACAAGLHRWRLVAIEQVIAAAARLVVIGSLAIIGHLTPLTGTLAIAITPILGSLAYLPLLAHRNTGRLKATATESDALRRMYSYGAKIWVGSMSGILLARIDQTLMVPLSNARQLGLYAVATSISEVTLVINSAVRDVSFAADASEQADERLTSSARISGALSLVLGAVIGLSQIYWLPVLFGAGFAPAVPSCLLLIASLVLGTPGAVAGAGLSARGRPGLRSASLAIACVVNIVAILIFVPHYGAMGASIATLIGATTASNLNIFFLWRESGIAPGAFYGLRSSDIETMRTSVSRLRQRFGGSTKSGRHLRKL